jgi:GNAT superfamily N-acetyltransferase
MERTIDELLNAYEEVFNKPETVFDNEPSREEIRRMILEESLEAVYMEGSKAFCLFRRTDLHTYTIEYLGTRVGHQGLGLGGRLLDVVIHQVICSSGDPLIKEVNLICPDDKVQFYLRRGFALRDKVLEGNRWWNKMVMDLTKK